MQLKLVFTDIVTDISRHCKLNVDQNFQTPLNKSTAFPANSLVQTRNIDLILSKAH